MRPICVRVLRAYFTLAASKPNRCVGQVRARQVRTKDFSLGSRSKGGRPRAGVGLMKREQQPPPHQLGGLRDRCELPQRGSGEPRPPEGFPLFLALRMASLDTIMLLELWTIMQQHWGGKTPVPPAYAPWARLYVEVGVQVRPHFPLSKTNCTSSVYLMITTPRFDRRSTPIRLRFHGAIRPFDDLRYDLCVCVGCCTVA